MCRRMRRRLIVTAISLWLGCLAATAQTTAKADDVAVIVNPNNSVSNLSMADLKKMFVGEKHSWPGGTPIKLVVRAPISHERTVLLQMLGMSEGEYKQYWTAQVVRGEAEMEPMAAPSFGMMKEVVGELKGAIGMVDAQNVKPGMKVIKIDGHMPGEEGYPLH
jgi:ABC-type phosphate transport system substrate-binding protein